MDCPFLNGDYIFTCGVNKVYIPSSFEVSEYCKGRGKRYTLCPFFKFKEQFDDNSSEMYVQKELASHAFRFGRKNLSKENL